MIARSPLVQLARHTPLAQSLRMLTPSLSRAACGAFPRNRRGERRGEMRRRARLGCRVRHPDTWTLIGDRTLDLSPEGMLLLSDERIDEGEELVVSFQATDLPIWFDTMACVTRIVQGRRPGDPGRALGLRFETLPAVSRLILRGYLSRLPAVPPARLPPPPMRPAPSLDYARIVQSILAS